MSGKFLMIYICNFHVLNHFLLIYICKLHWNLSTAVFLATGQDPAQNVESSNCLTNMEYDDDGVSLHVSVTMPSIEVGTVISL